MSRMRYSIPRRTAIAEHKRLISILKSGSRRRRYREARSQGRELKKIYRR